MKWKAAYPEYKDSGIEWLGQIPAHWEVKKLKRLATINDDVLPETTDPNFDPSSTVVNLKLPFKGHYRTWEEVLAS